jgi:hypothetical protein
MKTIFAVGALSMLLLTGTAWAQSTAADLKAVEACLESQEQNLGVKCIGMVADPCIKAADNDTEKAKACAARELAVWDRKMVSELKRVNAGGFKEIINAATQAQKTWQSSHRKLCAVFDKVEPGMLLGAAIYCRMHETAARVLILRRLGDAVNEH